MKTLEAKLDYNFKDKSLLRTALTHSSYANENKKLNLECNERLEFLGDSILGMVTAEHLFRNEPNMPEGKMTRLRAELVCERSLVMTADDWGLGELLLLGHGEEAGGGRTRPSIKADAVEAILAAMFLDGGIAPAKETINKFILSRLKTGLPSNQDYKTALQERLQRNGTQEIIYRVVGESGPDHCKSFEVAVYLNGGEIGRGEGRSKKNAEQMAAQNAMENFK